MRPMRMAGGAHRVARVTPRLAVRGLGTLTGSLRSERMSPRNGDGDHVHGRTDDPGSGHLEGGPLRRRRWATGISVALDFLDSPTRVLLVERGRATGKTRDRQGHV